MSDTKQCHSCTMPIESGTLCQYCGDEHGQLRPFDELFPRMVQWTMKNEAGISQADAESKTLQFMASMPAWQSHPDIRSRLGS